LKGGVSISLGRAPDRRRDAGPGLFSTTAPGHGRRLAAHRGHGDWFDTLVGLAIMWVFLRVCWAMEWGPDGG
jgi:hypothetical protein